MDEKKFLERLTLMKKIFQIKKVKKFSFLSIIIF